MFVTPINSQSSELPGPMRVPATTPTRKTGATSRLGPRAPLVSRMDAFTLALVGLNSSPLAEAALPPSTDLDDPAALALDAVPSSPAGAATEAGAALQTASVAARDAVAAMADAVEAFGQVATALATATAAVTANQAAYAAHPSSEIPGDPASLGADATAKYLGAGFLGPGSEAAPALQDDLRDVAPVAAANHTALNTYSNPHELAFGQTAAHLEALAEAAGAPIAGGLDLLS